MEQSGEAGRINISGATQTQIKTHFDCASRGQIEAKNKGPMEMFFLERLKPEFAGKPGHMAMPGAVSSNA